MGAAGSNTEDGNLFVGPADGKALPNPIGGRMVTKVRGEDTGSAYSIHDNTIPPGSPGPRPHLHRCHVEAFYVLEGELTVRVGTRKITAPAGSFVKGAARCRPPTLEPWDAAYQGAAHVLPCGYGALLRRGSRGAHAATGYTYRSGCPGEALGLHREVRLRVRGVPNGVVGSAYLARTQGRHRQRPNLLPGGRVPHRCIESHPLGHRVASFNDGSPYVDHG